MHHWLQAANVRSSSDDEARFIVPLSNFESRGPRAVGTSAAVGSFGVYDMGGNVREWCWNASGEQRFALGGFWGDPGYMLERGQAVSAWDRSAGNGFRCVRYPKPLVTRAKFGGPIPPPVRVDYRQVKPVPDAVFEMYRPLWSYERKPLRSAVVSVDDSSDSWRRIAVRVQAPYGNEQIVAYLFLPKQGKPPYQCVLYMGGNDILRPGSGTDVHPQSYILRSGRAMMYPIFKGVLERFTAPPTTPVSKRDREITWRKDLGASLDYLATRNDVDTSKLAFMGASMGANVAPMLLANEDRIRLLVMLSAGLRPTGQLPECDPVNFLPRVTIPTLLVTGRYDSIYPTDTAQEPILKLLGTPRADKKHVLIPTGHAVNPELRSDVAREVLDWLDRYFGSP